MKRRPHTFTQLIRTIPCRYALLNGSSADFVYVCEPSYFVALKIDRQASCVEGVEGTEVILNAADNIPHGLSFDTHQNELWHNLCWLAIQTFWNSECCESGQQTAFKITDSSKSRKKITCLVLPKLHFKICVCFAIHQAIHGFRSLGNEYGSLTHRVLNKCVKGFKLSHDDVIKWKHFSRYWPFVRGIQRSPVTSPHKGQWRGALIFSLICAWINGWVKNRGAGDLGRHRAHYDVIVMSRPIDDYEVGLFTSGIMIANFPSLTRSRHWKGLMRYREISQLLDIRCTMQRNRSVYKTKTRVSYIINLSDHAESFDVKLYVISLCAITKRFTIYPTHGKLFVEWIRLLLVIDSK